MIGYAVSGWAKFSMERARLSVLSRLSSKSLQAKCNALAVKSDDLEHKRRTLQRELDRRGAKWPEERETT